MPQSSPSSSGHPLSRRAVLRGALLTGGALALPTPESDFTGKTVLPALPDGADIYYRVSAVDLADAGLASEPISGHPHGR